MTNNITGSSLLLFGDYGTEVIRLSQMYDPSKAEYLKVEENTPYSPSTEYFVPTQRKRYVEFIAATPEQIDAGTIPDGHGGKLVKANSLWAKNPDYVENQSGNYVPVPQTLVVVDQPATTWGTYTLLVVDRVDDDESSGHVPTYESVLVPINFSGNVDDASRAIDYSNNAMMLYVEDITVGAGLPTVQRLVPDRKLMMYGSRPMRYAIRKPTDGIDVNICTNALSGAQAEHAEFINYFSASGRVVQVTSVADFKRLSSSRVSYFSAEEKKYVSATVVLELDDDGNIIPGSACEALFNTLMSVTAAGHEIIAEFDSQSLLTNVRIPGSCYLRKGFTPLVAGETVEFMVYEQVMDETGTLVDRLVYAAKLTVKSGVSSTNDLADGVITEFDVQLNNKQPSDIWEVDATTTQSKLALKPYLILEDGSRIDIAQDNKAFFAYGLEQFTGSQIVGTEFDILFKYFPLKNLGVKSNATIDARYAKVQNTTVPPSSIRPYFIKDGTGKFQYAGDKGRIDAFESGVEYYTIEEKLSWDSVTTRPHGECLVCRKRVRITTATDESIRKIVPIPYWDNSIETWGFKFLAYKSDYSRPKLLTFDDSDDGSIIFSGNTPAVLPELPTHRDGNADEVTYSYKLFYKPYRDGATTGSSDILMRLQHWTIHHGLSWYNRNRWQFSWDPSTQYTFSREFYEPGVAVPFGTHNESANAIRPFLNCEIVTDKTGTYGKYWVPQPTYDKHGNPNKDGFPNYPESSVESGNIFLKNFYFAALCANDTWARADSEGHTKYPTHFCVRSVTDTNVESKVIPITSTYMKDDGTMETNWIAYSEKFVCDGLPLPVAADDKHPVEVDAIVVVEFLYWNGATYEHLLGVPVEVRPYTA